MFTKEQLRAARALAGWGVRDLAEKASVAANTVSRFENGGDMRVSTMGTIQKVFEQAGIEFIAENGGGAGVRFRERAGGDG